MKFDQRPEWSRGKRQRSMEREIFQAESRVSAKVLWYERHGEFLQRVRQACLEQWVMGRMEEDGIREVSRSWNKSLSVIIRTLDFIVTKMGSQLESFEQMNDMVWSSCLLHISTWMSHKYLKLNVFKILNLLPTKKNILLLLDFCKWYQKLQLFKPESCKLS